MSIAVGDMFIERRRKREGDLYVVFSSVLLQRKEE
jgi:hypothetical protein